MAGASLLRLACLASALWLERSQGIRIDSDSQLEVEERKAGSVAGADAVAGDQTKVLVITVPKRPMSMDRMKRLRPRLKKLGLEMTEIEGPNMEEYCPNNVSDKAESLSAGEHLLLQEWHGKTPDLKTYNLQLFQMATLVGHLRAWQHIADTKTPALILEDDADIKSSQALHRALAADPTANAVLLDRRHCNSKHEPPHLDPQASGMAGYWLDGKAAGALLEHFPLNIPIDWGVNEVFNKDVRTVCPGIYPVTENGGESFARTHSAFHGCNRDGKAKAAHGPHPVSFLLKAQVIFQGAEQQAFEAPASRA